MGRRVGLAEPAALSRCTVYAWPGSGPAPGISGRQCCSSSLDLSRPSSSRGLPCPVRRWRSTVAMNSSIAAVTFCVAVGSGLSSVIGTACHARAGHLRVSVADRCCRGLPGSVPELAEDADQFGAVGGAKAAEDAPGFGTPGGADLGQDAGAVLGHLDQGGAPVARVGAPPDQVPCLASVRRARRWAGVWVRGSSWPPP